MREFFTDIVPALRMSDSAADLQTYGRDWLKRLSPDPSLILFPESVQQVQEVVRRCAASRIALVPSGGRSGQSGGAVAEKKEVVLSLERMRKVTALRPIERTLQCEAGVTLAEVQQRAESQNLFFPIDFSSKGSAQIGGCLATNAGGIHVMKYGNIRNWVLGLEVVKGDGELLNLNRRLIKNNTGYDLKNLIIGSEGTLGIITAATLLLTCKPGETMRALCAISELDPILPLLRALRDSQPDLSAFELIDRLSISKVIRHRNMSEPFQQIYPYYVLVEFEHSDDRNREQVENSLLALIEQGLVRDIISSQSSKQALELLAYREQISATLSEFYVPFKFDISVPVEEIPQFLSELNLLLHSTFPNFELALFGHVADGNVHVNVLKPGQLQTDEFYAHCTTIETQVYELLAKLGGSVAAEHGVGLLKKHALPYSRTSTEIEVMRGIKRVLDPYGILNPGKIFTDRSASDNILPQSAQALKDL